MPRGWRKSVHERACWDLDLPVPVNDARRLEVVVGLPLFGGAQLAVDSTLVSALHCDGSARRGRATVMGGSGSSTPQGTLAPSLCDQGIAPGSSSSLERSLAGGWRKRALS